MKYYNLIKELINDFVGSIIAFWGCYDLMINPRWEYVVLVFIGGTMVFGKKLSDKLPIPGLGGENNDTK